MNKKKLLSIILAVAVGVGAVYGIGFAVRKTTSGGTVMVVSADSLNYGWYAGGSSESVDGTVTTDATQNVYVTSAETIEQIYVKAGDTVKKGDPLVLFDTEQSAIALEQRRLELEQLRLSIDVAEKNIETLKRIVPISEDVGEEGEEGEFDEDMMDEEGEELEPYATLDPFSVAVNAIEDAENIGKGAYPLRYFVNGNKPITVKKEFIQQLVDQAKEQQMSTYFVRLEAHEDDLFSNPVACNGTAFYDFNVMRLDGLKKDLTINFTEGKEPFVLREIGANPEDDPVSDEELIEKLRSQITELEEAAAAQQEEADAKDQEIADLQKEIEDLKKQLEEAGSGESEDTAQLKEQIQTLEKQVSDLQTESTKKDAEKKELENTITELEARIKELEQQIKEPEEGQSEGEGSEEPPSTGMITAGSLLHRIFFAKAEVRPAFRLALASPAIRLVEEEGLSVLSGPRLISPNAEYSRDELKQAIADEEASLESLLLDERESALKLKIEEQAVNEGKVLATMDGVVKTINEAKDASTNGVPLIQVTGSQGLFVRGNLSETMLEKVAVGDPVTVQSWQTGMVYDAEITEISPYPSSNVFYGYYSSNSSASSYPFLACITDTSVALDQSEYLQISFGSGSGEEEMMMDGSALYLYKAFVLEENGKKYVFKRGDDGLLHKQEIEVGELSGQGWKIISGVTMDDYVAFPYGKDVKEGAKTREGTMDELYLS